MIQRMISLDAKSTFIKKFNQLSLTHRALLASVLVWSLALLWSVVYCVYYTRYVTSEPRDLIQSLLWFFQEYGIWFILTPILLIGLSHFSEQRRFGRFWFLIFFLLFLSISFRMALDFYLNPTAKFVSSLVYFSPNHLFVTIIVVLGWALVFRRVEKSFSINVQSETDDIFKVKLSESEGQYLEAYKGNSKVMVSINTIELVSAAGNYVELHCADNQFLMRSTMKELEEQLKPYNFVRIHRSHLVNPVVIESIQSDDTLVLTNGATLSISQRYKKNLIIFNKNQ